MQKPHAPLRAIITSLGIITAFFTAITCLQAAPKVTKLTPPSELFLSGDPHPPYISRFLPGQRFDLQATIVPDALQSITSVHFLVDGITVPGNLSAVSATVAGRLVVSLRAYSNSKAGIHTLSVVATQTDSQTVTANGNFEVVPLRPTGWGAKNIIILIGDGMGIAHRTAARIMKNGVSQGKANAALSMDLFPVTGMVMTHSINSIVTDSSPGASCYATGNKSANNQHGVFPDDTTANTPADNFDNPRVESIGEYLHRTQGRALGLVSTADLFDSTPAAFGSHTQARASGTGIIDTYFDERESTGLTVLMGGGRKWFLPNTTTGSGRTAVTDGILPADAAAAWGVPQGAVDPGRDLLSEFVNAGYWYVGDNTSLNAVPAGTKKLLGLFSLSNMSVAKDKIDKRRNPSTPGVVDIFGFPDQPMLDDMTDKALEVLKESSNGFVVMIEGASIDKQSHLMDAERAILDTIEFDRAIERCRQFALKNPDTLVVVTADHECGGMALIGGSRVTHAQLLVRAASGGGAPQLRTGVVGTLELAGFPNYGVMLPDGYPLTTDIDFRMLFNWGNGPDRFEDWITNPFPLSNASHSIVTSQFPAGPLQRDTNGNFLITGPIPDAIATHTASDIPLSAFGKGASLFTGVMDNTDVFFKVMQTALGDAGLQAEQRVLFRNPNRGYGPPEQAADASDDHGGLE
jgi:alkaline phosphatase